MNIVLVNFGKNELLDQARKSFSKALYAKGHIVKELNGITDYGKIVGFQYAILFAEAGGLFRQNVIPAIETFLKNNENLCSKYISIYTHHKFQAEKWLCRYMSCLERFGI
ncbi:MAG: hypothetical protein II707_07315, partial [Spirochaetales bacterium]|nr:hypothetical protein [Spirochaetales bacterium]